ncbi:MAG: RHS repeat-associated core domain-containing protein, partial [Planctomycetes bacterium]|nr:RHS repeat-associated core domain-containing protein [Planctomycetota bacterium]
TKQLPGPENSPPSTIIFVYDGWKVLEERDGDGNILAEYTHGLYIDEYVTIETGGKTAYYHQDTIYNVKALTDKKGKIIERYAYTAYGEPSVLNKNGMPVPRSKGGNRYLFQGRRLDRESGLYYFRHRMMSGELGRFLQRDPVAKKAEVNLYSFVAANTLAIVDPLGLRLRIYCKPAEKKGIRFCGGNHAYLWSTEWEMGAEMTSSSGSHWQGTNGPRITKEEERAPGGVDIDKDSYYVVPGSYSRSKEKKVIDNLIDSANNYLIWCPGELGVGLGEDCHSVIKKVLQRNGLEYPGAPGGRWGTVPDIQGYRPGSREAELEIIGGLIPLKPPERHSEVTVEFETSPLDRSIELTEEERYFWPGRMQNDGYMEDFRLNQKEALAEFLRVHEKIK